MTNEKDIYQTDENKHILTFEYNTEKDAVGGLPCECDGDHPAFTREYFYRTLLTMMEGLSLKDVGRYTMMVSNTITDERMMDALGKHPLGQMLQSIIGGGTPDEGENIDIEGMEMPPIIRELMAMGGKVVGVNEAGMIIAGKMPIPSDDIDTDESNNID